MNKKGNQPECKNNTVIYEDFSVRYLTDEMFVILCFVTYGYIAACFNTQFYPIIRPHCCVRYSVSEAVSVPCLMYLFVQFLCKKLVGWSELPFWMVGGVQHAAYAQKTMQR